jgi:hypothetical protein
LHLLVWLAGGTGLRAGNGKGEPSAQEDDSLRLAWVGRMILSPASEGKTSRSLPERSLGVLVQPAWRGEEVFFQFASSTTADAEEIVWVGLVGGAGYFCAAVSELEADGEKRNLPVQGWPEHSPALFTAD